MGLRSPPAPRVQSGGHCRVWPGAGAGAGRRGQRGLALVTVLWVLMLLSLVAASFTLTTRTEINVTRNLIENAKAKALADAGVYRAILGSLHPKETR